MALHLESLKESNLIVYLIKTSNNDRVRNIRNFLTPVERTAKIVVKETESHRKFNRMFSDLCMVAVTALSDIEDVLYEHTHPGSSAADADINEIEEISEKRLIADLSRYAATGSKLGAAYMENLGAISIKSTARKKRERVSQEIRSVKKKNKPTKEKSSNIMTEGLGSLDDLIQNNVSVQYSRSHGVMKVADLSREDFRLGSLQELQVSVNPWLISAPETGQIPRTTVEREKKQGWSQMAGSAPPILDICLTSDPSLFMQKWESREYALNASSSRALGGLPTSSSASHARKRRRPSPPSSMSLLYPNGAAVVPPTITSSSSNEPAPGPGTGGEARMTVDKGQQQAISADGVISEDTHDTPPPLGMNAGRHHPPPSTSTGSLSLPLPPSTGSASRKLGGGDGVRTVSSFFPSLQNPHTAEVAPPIMRSIVHCGVAHLDLPV